MDTSISDSESSKIRTLLITMAFMRTNTGTPNVQMSPMLPLLLMNSDLSTDNDLVMMALLIDQLGNNQSQDSFFYQLIISINPYPWILDKKFNKNFKILILGFELASFLDKKLMIRPRKRMKTLKDEYDAAITSVGSGGNIKRQFAACSCNDNI